ncbi:MAG: NAD(P)H-hydrate dehydratase [Candidatus Aenigmarchaeota archaeon]|nr:NAD(P)H-hydrate dehydratase [Candidatus Aenigmarchaeota archaeon]
MKYITKSILKKIFRPRDKWSHKRDFGHLLIIGGSHVYTGPPIFNALAAYRTGVDLVSIISPKRAADIAASYAPELITYPVEGKFFNKRHVKTVLEIIEEIKPDVCVIGGGITKNNNVSKFIVKILENIYIPCVIDADALYILSKNVSLIKENYILTPHSKEFYYLTGLLPPKNLHERVNLVKQKSLELGCTILLKGYLDIISNGNEVLINKTGTPAMTVGGTGDVLAGIAGALVSMKNDAFISAVTAAFISGKAGEYAFKKYGFSLLPSDVINEIPKVIKSLIKAKNR